MEWPDKDSYAPDIAVLVPEATVECGFCGRLLEEGMVECPVCATPAGKAARLAEMPEIDSTSGPIRAWGSEGSTARDRGRHVALTWPEKEDVPDERPKWSIPAGRARLLLLGIGLSAMMAVGAVVYVF